MVTHKFKTFLGWFWFRVAEMAAALACYAEDQRCLKEGYYNGHTHTWNCDDGYWVTETRSTF